MGGLPRGYVKLPLTKSLDKASDFQGFDETAKTLGQPLTGTVNWYILLHL